MTQPTSNNVSAPAPAPPDPRIQAMTFALQFALTNKATSLAAQTDIDSLIANAEKIHQFITTK